MRITCPACNASYDVPDAMLGGGRSVRCVRCLREWQPSPPAPAAATPPAREEPASRPAETPDAPVPYAGPGFQGSEFDLPDAGRPRFGASHEEGAPAPALSAEPRGPGRRVAWREARLAGGANRPAAAGRSDGWVGWLASLVLLAALLAAAVAYRAEVERAWPPSGRVYAALGLHAQP